MYEPSVMHSVIKESVFVASDELILSHVMWFVEVCLYCVAS